ncbi:MAG TPA: hypothetical protein DC058_19030 [Planctomycetaceae bacterium]|nr:hypothetical protein [Planctomycetaceae bacterium]
MAVSDVQEEGPIGEISGQAERSIGHAVERQDLRYLTRLLWEKQRRIGEISGNRAELSAGASAINQVLPLRSLQGTTMHESEAADGYEWGGVLNHEWSGGFEPRMDTNEHE